MTRRSIFPLIFGLVGCAVLISLGIWQVQRLAWKENVLAEISARLSGDPIDFAQVDLGAGSETLNYVAVKLRTRFSGQELHVYAPKGYNDLHYRVLAQTADVDSFTYIDLGLVPAAQKHQTRLRGVYDITGHLAWPDDFDTAFTSDPDLDKNIWFARQIDYLETHLGFRPLFVVASKVEPLDGTLYSDTQLVPISTNISNDHREYAITWFSLAAVWFGMTVFWLWRIRQRPD